MYYLQSRYYDPELGRYINADALVSTGQGLLGNNMFAYCRNCPVCRIDISGTVDQDAFDADGDVLEDEEILGSKGGGGPSPASGSQGTATSNGGSGNGGSTVIYRFGYTGPEKLVPTQRDVNSDTGLSFSTRYRSGAAMTTIDRINSTGVLIAIQDGGSHVSVYPTGATIEAWHYAGVHSIWTQTLISVVTMS